MAKQVRQEITEANLSNQERQAAIPKIERRIADLNSFDIESISSRQDASISALEQKLDTLIVSIFGANTVENRRYSGVSSLDTASYNMMYDTPIEEVKASLRKNVSSAIATLEAIKEGFTEELEGIRGSRATPRNRTSCR